MDVYVSWGKGNKMRTEKEIEKMWHQVCAIADRDSRDNTKRQIKRSDIRLGILKALSWVQEDAGETISQELPYPNSALRGKGKVHMRRIDERSLEVVCICGSMRFTKELKQEEKRLTEEGKVVLGPIYIDREPSKEEGEMLMAIHRRKILMSDRIHVVNVNGYIGLGLQEELSFQPGKPTTYYESNDEKEKEEANE